MRLALALCSFGLTACGGERLLSTSVVQQAVLLRAFPQPTATTAANQFVYVANNGNRTVTVYPALANGNVPPTRRLAGSNTLIYGTIGGIAQDGAGNLYVGDHQNGVLVFAPGATGNERPIRRIFGSATMLGNVQALAVDTAGNVFAATEVYSGGRPSFARLLRFNAGANGNVAPAAALIPGQEITCIALDTTGANIVVVAPALQSSAGSNTYTFSRAFTANSSALYDVGGFVGGALVSDFGNASYFEYAYDQNEVVRFANGTQGSTYPSGSFGALRPPPRQFLYIAPAGLALDASRDILATFGDVGTGTVNAYANNASGYAGTLRRITGTNTGLSQPQAVYVGK